jgi:hypothetical protein
LANSDVTKPISGSSLTKTLQQKLVIKYKLPLQTRNLITIAVTQSKEFQMAQEGIQNASPVNVTAYVNWPDYKSHYRDLEHIFTVYSLQLSF